MKIKTIEVQNDGSVHCRSAFYTATDFLHTSVTGPICFSTGTNLPEGEIDSGNWAVSYYLSMYKPRSKDFLLAEPANVLVNGEVMSVESFMKYSCYLDLSYPLFSSHRTVRALVTKGLKKSGLAQSAEEIKLLFDLNDQRFERPLQGVGNERFRCMAAIGYANGKQVFCLPWLSKKRYDYFHGHMQALFDTLNALEMITIVPVGK